MLYKQLKRPVSQLGLSRWLWEGNRGGGGWGVCCGGERADDPTLVKADSSASLREEMARRAADGPSAPYKKPLCAPEAGGAAPIW